MLALRRFIATVVAALAFAAPFVAIESAKAAGNVLTSLSLTSTVKNSAGEYASDMLVISHPSNVLCANSSCTFGISYRFDRAIANYIYVDVIDGNGMKIGSQLGLSGTTTARSATVYVTATADTNLVFVISGSSNYPYRSDRVGVGVTWLKISKTVDNFEIPTAFSSEVISTSTSTALYANKFAYMKVAYPTQMRAVSECMTVNVFVVPLDLFTGGQLKNGEHASYDFTVAFADPTGATVDTKMVYGSRLDWNITSAETRVESQICGFNTKLDARSSVLLRFTMVTRVDGVATTTYANGRVDFVGTQRWSSIVCTKGTAYKVVTAARPTCSSGYKESSIRIVNGQPVKSSITCSKGLKVQRFTAVVPACPAGWKRK